jgi:hypothetical protein
MQLTVELSEMPFPVSPFTKPGRPGEKSAIDADAGDLRAATAEDTA